MSKGTAATASGLVESYTRLYHGLPDSLDRIYIDRLVPHHCLLESSLHKAAGSEQVNLSAFIYSAQRLPDCISRVDHVVIGSTEKLFEEYGFNEVLDWPCVDALSRRRRSHYDGRGSLGIFVTSVSDLDDLLPVLCAYQIEWNKMHQRLSRSELGQELAAGRIPAAKVGDAIRQIIGLSVQDWDMFGRVWQSGWGEKISLLAAGQKQIIIDRLPLRRLDCQSSAAQWLQDVLKHFKNRHLDERPVYLISSNNHSIANLVSGYVSHHLDDLSSDLMKRSTGEALRYLQRLRNEKESVHTNLYYYALKDYLEEHPEKKIEKLAMEESAGLWRYTPDHLLHLEAQVLDVCRIDPDRLDPRLSRHNLEKLKHSNALILNLDYPLGYAAYHILREIFAQIRNLQGVFIQGKAAAMIGRLGDITIPTEVHDSHSGTHYHFNNCFTARHVVPFLDNAAVFDDQRSITVRGTFLHSWETVKDLHRVDFMGIEMEAGPYLTAIDESFPRFAESTGARSLYLKPPPGFHIGLLHYTSDTPYNVRASLLSSSLGLAGLEATYACSLSILRFIMDQEIKKCLLP
ncbi:MAG: DUF6909 family protein [Syntrophales bacterium]